VTILSPNPLKTSDKHRTCRNMWHLWIAPSCSWQRPCCRKTCISLVSPWQLSRKLGISIIRCTFALHVTIHVCFIHVSVTRSWSSRGASNSWPVRPSSSCMISPVAHNRKPVSSCGWFENLRRVWMWANVCSVYRLGILTPQNSFGPCANACGNVQI